MHIVSGHTHTHTRMHACTHTRMHTHSINFLGCVYSYSYLGIEFACNGGWDIHIDEEVEKEIA